VTLKCGLVPRVAAPLRGVQAACWFEGESPHRELRSKEEQVVRRHFYRLPRTAARMRSSGNLGVRSG
jgi:hypothetical protein